MKGTPRKVFGTIIAMAMLAAMFLAGCASAGVVTGAPTTAAAATTAQASATQSAAPAVEPLKPVKLRFYFPGDKKAATDEVWAALADKFKAQLNCTYEVNFIPFGDYKDKLIVMAASGDNWDMNYDGPWQAYTQMQNKGAYMDLSKLLPQYAPDLNKKYQETGTLAPATVGGKIVALPWTLSGSLRPWIDWRSDLPNIAALNIQTNSVKTVDDVDKLLHDIKKAYPDKTTMCVGNIMLGQVFDITLLRDGYMATEFHNLYVKADDPKCTLIPIETTDTFKNTVILTRKWVEDGIISKDEMVDKTYAADKWYNGTVLARTITHEYSFCNNPFLDPTFKRDSSELYPENKFFNRTPLGNCMCVNKNAANPERSLMWMNMMETSQDFYDMVFYGIPGKTYNLDGKAAKYPDGMTQANSNYMDWTGQWTLWKPQFMRPDATYGDGFWQKEADYAKLPQNINNPIDGLFFNTDSVKNEIARRDQLYEELGKPLVFGLVKNEDIDKSITDYVAQEKAAGLDKIISECQAQVDAFLAAKK